MRLILMLIINEEKSSCKLNKEIKSAKYIPCAFFMEKDDYSTVTDLARLRG